MRLLKAVLLIIITAQALACVIINESSRDRKNGTKFAFVNIDPSFSEDQRSVIEWSILYFQDTIDCITLEVVDTAPPTGVEKTIFIKPLQKSDLIAGNEIGLHLFKNKKETILVQPSNDRTLIAKVTLHELAHAFGMPGDHAFPKILQDRSLLSPIIGNKALPIFYDKDKSYLNSLICGSK